MQLLIVRHGIAQEYEDASRRGISEEARGLTEEGRDKMNRAARGLKTRLDKLDLIFHSPLVRAQQTAEIIAAAYKGVQLDILKELRPECDPAHTLATLSPLIANCESVAIVGHQPHVSSFISYALAAHAANFVTMKKGAMCLLEFPGRVREGQAILRWHVNNSFLRDIA